MTCCNHLQGRKQRKNIEKDGAPYEFSTSQCFSTACVSFVSVLICGGFRIKNSVCEKNLISRFFSIFSVFCHVSILTCEFILFILLESFRPPKLQCEQTHPTCARKNGWLITHFYLLVLRDKKFIQNGERERRVLG